MMWSLGPRFPELAIVWTCGHDTVINNDYDTVVNNDCVLCVQVGVHIADVSHFIRPGTALDKEAASRGTTVYLTDMVNCSAEYWEGRCSGDRNNQGV